MTPQHNGRSPTGLPIVTSAELQLAEALLRYEAMLRLELANPVRAAASSGRRTSRTSPGAVDGGDNATGQPISSQQP